LAVLHRKKSAVARTLQAVTFLRVVHGTGKMHAFLTVGYVLFCGRSYEDAMVLWVGISKQLDFAYGNLSKFCNCGGWIGRSRSNAVLTLDESRS